MTGQLDSDGGGAPPRFELRPATPADAVALAELWTNVYVRSGLTGDREPFSKQRALAGLRACEGRVAVDRAGRIVGVVLLAPHGAPAANLTRGPADAQILLLAVDADARGTGVGRGLVSWCVQSARGRGGRTVWLWSRTKQQPAHRVYESLGFVRVPERDDEAGGPRRLVFELEL